jgi:hypothetical protein
MTASRANDHPAASRSASKDSKVASYGQSKLAATGLFVKGRHAASYGQSKLAATSLFVKGRHAASCRQPPAPAPHEEGLPRWPAS